MAWCRQGIEPKENKTRHINAYFRCLGLNGKRVYDMQILSLQAEVLWQGRLVQADLVEDYSGLGESLFFFQIHTVLWLSLSWQMKMISVEFNKWLEEMSISKDWLCPFFFSIIVAWEGITYCARYRVLHCTLFCLKDRLTSTENGSLWESPYLRTQATFGQISRYNLIYKPVNITCLFDSSGHYICRNAPYVFWVLIFDHFVSYLWEIYTFPSQEYSRGIPIRQNVQELLRILEETSEE